MYLWGAVEDTLQNISSDPLKSLPEIISRSRSWGCSGETLTLKGAKLGKFI